MASGINFGLSVDFRSSTRWPRPYPELFREVVESTAEAERLGFDYVWLGEHHFSSDGYAPSNLITASAIAQRTSTIRIATGVVLLPLHHPVRIAEDAALIDILSDGRFELGVAVGWREAEFAAYGVPRQERGARTDEALEVITRLWSGEPVTHRGRFFQLDEVQLAPLPPTRPRPRIWIGGMPNRYAPATLSRAARWGDGLIATTVSPATYQHYREALEAEGRDPDSGLVTTGYRWFMVSEDPQATFEEVAPYILEWVNHYSRWMAGTKGTNGYIVPVETPDDLRQHGFLQVVRPAEAVDMIKAEMAEIPIHCFNIKLRPIGYPLDLALAHLELFAEEVVAKLR